MTLNIINKIVINSKIYVAINSFSLLLLLEEKIKINKNFIFWPDGIICKLYGFKKIPGRELFEQLLTLNLNFCLITSPNIIDKFPNQIKKRIELVEVGFEDPINMFNSIGLIKSDIIVLTLPTPKQEELALYLHDKYNNKTILCLGGAINMYLGIEKRCPNILSNLGFEFIWRLHKDPIRRFKRLFTLFRLYKLLNANIKFK